MVKKTSQNTREVERHDEGWFSDGECGIEGVDWVEEYTWGCEEVLGEGCGAEGWRSRTTIRSKDSMDVG